MPVPEIADVLRVVVYGSNGTLPMQNVLHVRGTSPLTQPDAQDIADLIAVAYGNLTDQMNASAAWERMKVYDLGETGGPQFDILPATWPIVGTLTEASLPPQTAALVRWGTGGGGRSGQGRTYLGGFDEDTSDGNNIDTACLTALGDFGLALRTAVDLVIVSYYLGTEPADKGQRRLKPVARVTPQVRDVVSHTVPGKWVTQRRRTDSR